MKAFIAVLAATACLSLAGPASAAGLLGSVLGGDGSGSVGASASYGGSGASASASASAQASPRSPGLGGLGAGALLNGAGVIVDDVLVLGTDLVSDVRTTTFRVLDNGLVVIEDVTGLVGVLGVADGLLTEEILAGLF